MRIATGATTLGLILLLASALAACVPDDVPAVPPAPAPSSAPVFESDEEALAAAEEAYGRYEAVTNAAGQTGWADTSKYVDVLVGDALADELDGAKQAVQLGYRQVGDSTHDTVSLQQVQDQGRGTVRIVVYLCSDVSLVDVLDKDGNSVVSASRPDRQSFEVELMDVDGELKVGRTDAWSGQSFC